MVVRKIHKQKTTTLKWKEESEAISINLPGRVDAAYSESRELVITAGTDGHIRAFSLNGDKTHDFVFNNSDSVKFYAIGISTASKLGVTIVMAHNPEYRNERFWQHEINLDTGEISEPIAKWR